MKKMTREEFRDACIASGACTVEEAFTSKWCTGGTSGDLNGNVSPLAPDEPEDVYGLDDFLMKHFPNTTFLQYRAIQKAIQTTDSESYDYYGGTAYYRAASLSFGDLAIVLNSLGLLLIINPEKI